MSGYIGRWIIAFSRSEKVLKRITGLDPAGPMFYEDEFHFIPTIALSLLDAEVSCFKVLVKCSLKTFP